MNPRKLMGRLNASTVRFDIGRGGIPELTAQDIAAALAYVRDELAREVFTAIWCPELARLAREDILVNLRKRVFSEYIQRARAEVAAKLDLHLAEGHIAAKRSMTMMERSILSKLRGAVTATHEAAWPGEPAVYPRICSAVVAELSGAGPCTACGGRGGKHVDAAWTACENCAGRGVQRSSDAQRAAWIGKATLYSRDGHDTVDAAYYKRRWRPVYDWVMELAQGAEREAASDIARALRTETEREGEAA